MFQEIFLFDVPYICIHACKKERESTEKGRLKINLQKRKEKKKAVKKSRLGLNLLNKYIN